jgi:hypothetical protein
MTELKRDAYSQLTKDQLIWIIDQWESCGSAIIETMVDKSKSHITAEDACSKILKYVSANSVVSLDYLRVDHLKAELDFHMGKISKSECRKRLGLD